MSTHAATTEKHSPHQTAATDVKFSKEDALDCREFEQLVRGAISLDPGFAIQAEFAIMVCGRLGLRSGELTHLTEEWIDWRRNLIEIPAHHACQKGRDGGRCGYCRQLAKQSAECSDEFGLDEALEWRWHPKTEAAVRAVPFGWNARVELAIERFFDAHNEWPISKQGVNRRLDRANDAAPLLDAPDLTPHNLRATAASKMAADGLDSLMIQGMLGWADPSVAERYIRTSPDNIARSLEQVARQ